MSIRIPAPDGAYLDHYIDWDEEAEHIAYQVAEIIPGKKDYRILSGCAQIVCERREGDVSSRELLKAHLRVAEKMRKYVLERVLFSSNFVQRMRPNAVYTSSCDLGTVLEYVREAMTRQERVRRAIQYGVGNCFEMVLVGLECPDAKGVSVECYEVVEGDHGLIVIGRNPDTDPNHFLTWNAETVICDPWLNACLPINRITNLVCCFGFYNALQQDRKQRDFNSNCTVIRQFNSETDDIQPYDVDAALEKQKQRQVEGYT